MYGTLCFREHDDNGEYYRGFYENYDSAVLIPLTEK